MRAFIIPVADEQPLAVLARRLAARIPRRAGRILEPDGHRLGQLAAGVRLAREQRGARAADGLPAEIEMQHRAGEHIPRHLHRAAALQHDTDVRIDLRDLAQKVELVFAQAHMLAVVSFRFAALVQTEEEQHLIASRGERPCPAQQPRRSGSAAEKALFVSGDVHAGSAQRVERRVHLRGIDARAARALIARHGGKIADDGDALALPQREKFLFVFQQHGRLRRGFRGERVVRRAVENAAARERFLRGKNKVQHVIHLLVQKGLVERPVLYGLDDVPVGLAVGGRHFERRSGAHGGDAVVVAAPVGDDEPVKAPLAAEDIAQQVLVFVAVSTVQPVICRHKRAHTALFYGGLKRRKIDLAQRPLVHDGIGRHAAQLLRVCGKVLHTCAHAGALYAADHRRGELAGEQRVLGEILKVPPAERAALDVHARPEHHADALRHGLLAERASNGREQRFVPAVRKRARRRKARRRNGAAKAQRVRIALLLAQAVRPVRHHLGRNAEPFHGLRVPEIPSGREPRLFLQRQLGNEIGVFHMRALPTL